MTDDAGDESGNESYIIAPTLFGLLRVTTAPASYARVARFDLMQEASYSGEGPRAKLCMLASAGRWMSATIDVTQTPDTNSDFNPPYDVKNAGFGYPG